MILSFHPCFIADRQIILGDRRLNADDFNLIGKAKAIILPQSCSSELYRACKNSSTHIFPNYELRFQYRGKIGQTLLFKKLNYPFPKTMIWHSVKHFRNAYNSPESYPHRVPFFIKAEESHEAEGVYLIRDRASLDLCLENLVILEESGASGFISQELIPTEGNVLRAVIMGAKTITYWKRPEKPGEIITTLGQGAKIDKDWRPDLQGKGSAMAKRFSASTGTNLAAIDFVFPIFEPDPGPLFLEINYYFGRRGLGGTLNYYRLLYNVIQEWLKEQGFDPNPVKLI